MVMSELPKGWVECQLEDILINLESGSRPKGGVRNISEGIPSIGGEHLDYSGGFNFTNLRFVPESFAKKMSRGHIRKKDILIVKDGATTGKTSFVNNNFPYESAVVNEHVFICRTSSLLEPKFVFRFLTSKDGQNNILSNFQGSAQGGINTKFVSNTIVPLAPLKEQKRIVEKLDKLLARVEEAKSRLEKIPVIIKRFRQSVLNAAVTGELTKDWSDKNKTFLVSNDYEAPERIPFEIPESWKWSKWIDVVSKEKHSFKRGPFGGALKKEIFVKSGYKVYEQCNPINDNCDLGNYYITKEKYEELFSFRVKAFDLLISCSGVTLGRITQVPGKYKEGIINQALLKVTLDTEKISNDYFIKYFRSRTFQTYLFENAQGSAQPNIKGVKELKELPIPLPHPEEQKEIVKRVEALFKKADEIEERYKKAKAYVDKLTQSILAKAFRGELLPQDPNDESAEKLLERIKAEKEKLSKEKGKNKL